MKIFRLIRIVVPCSAVTISILPHRAAQTNHADVISYLLKQVSREDAHYLPRNSNTTRPRWTALLLPRRIIGRRICLVTSSLLKVCCYVSGVNRSCWNSPFSCDPRSVSLISLHVTWFTVFLAVAQCQFLRRMQSNLTKSTMKAAPLWCWLLPGTATRQSRSSCKTTLTWTCGTWRTRPCYITRSAALT